MNTEFSLIWLVLLLPVLGFLVLALAGSALEKALGRRVLGAVAVLPVAISFVLSAIVTQRLGTLSPDFRSVVVPGIPWIDILGLNVPFELIVDPLSLTMALIITGVGSLIFLYATGYMAEEREYSRFFTYMNLFAASMLLLVLGNNLPLLFIGWEGVGLCSYLLIGFWYKDIANARAANKAFIVNRIGDWGLTLGIFLILVMVAGTAKHLPSGRYLSYDTLSGLLQMALIRQPGLATAAGLLLFVGAAGKSAQFPLYVWLPDAMAGPTPVSALIHAATMVTSGVVLLNRLHVVFEYSAVASAVVCGVGAFTALFAAIIAFAQVDIKRVLAYSTVSQLGFMFLGCGAGAYWAGMFHVTTHAFFKALLFLGAGAVIHAMAHDQDMRNYGNLRKYLPITFGTMIIGWLAICAVWPLSGFFSKDALIGAALANDYARAGNVNVSMIAGWVGLITAVLTAAYMTRLTCLTFFGKEERWRKLPEGHHDGEVGHSDDDHGHGLTPEHTPKEVPPSMLIPLVVLAVLSLVGGFVLNSNGMLENWLKPSSDPLVNQIEAEPTGIPLFAISLGAALLGILAGLYYYWKALPTSEGPEEAKWSPVRRWVYRQFGFDDALTVAAVQGGDQLATLTWTAFDNGLIDGIVNGVGWFAAELGKALSAVQRGLVRSYALLMLIGGIAILGYIFLSGGGR
jgi:NADH-quinone oxidoreductase subunit L